MLSRLSIRTKLVALVSLLLVALTAMGLFAIIEMRAINASAQDIKARWLPSVRLLEMRRQALAMKLRTDVDATSVVPLGTL